MVGAGEPRLVVCVRFGGGLGHVLPHLAVPCAQLLLMPPPLLSPGRHRCLPGVLHPLGGEGRPAATGVCGATQGEGGCAGCGGVLGWWRVGAAPALCSCLAVCVHSCCRVVACWGGRVASIQLPPIVLPPQHPAAAVAPHAPSAIVPLSCPPPLHLPSPVLAPTPVAPPQVKRTNVAAMMAQQGFVDDVWAAATKYLKERKRK